MDKKLLEYVRNLSLNDSKSLSQKGLKLAEECGEIARVILPFDNAFATNHRFVERRQILEECADVMLVALSIAYDIDATDEELTSMMFDKAAKWQHLQIRSGRVIWPIPFEIHITVENGVIETFKAACEQIGVKPILLDLHTTNGIFQDLQTSSIHIGDNRSAYEEMTRISEYMESFGYKVIRKKIETVPWHPAAPHQYTAPDQTLAHPEKMPWDCYFETHLSVITTDGQLEQLRHFAKITNAHLSRNVFKRIDGETYKMMVTYRDYEGPFERFDEHKQKIELCLREAGFVVDKTVTEFSLYDSKVSHDTAWLEGTTSAV